MNLVRIGNEVFEQTEHGRRLFATWTRGSWYRETSRSGSLVEWDVVPADDAARCEAAPRQDVLNDR